MSDAMRSTGHLRDLHSCDRATFSEAQITDVEEDRPDRYTNLPKGDLGGIDAVEPQASRHTRWVFRLNRVTNTLDSPVGIRRYLARPHRGYRSKYGPV